MKVDEVPFIEEVIYLPTVVGFMWFGQPPNTMYTKTIDIAKTLQIL